MDYRHWKKGGIGAYRKDLQAVERIFQNKVNYLQRIEMLKVPRPHIKVREERMY